MDKALVRAVALHDEALLLRPDGASHDSDLCRICTDWAMTADGVPSGFSRLSEQDRPNPYGEVMYADSGYRDGVQRYPLDTLAHAQQAWSYINDESHARKYSREEFADIRSRIEAALLEFGIRVEASREEVTLPEGESMADTVTQETHEALLKAGVEKATADLQAEKAKLEEQVAGLTAERDEAVERADTAETENERLNGELDSAQVKVTSLEEAKTNLERDIAARDEAARLAELATKRGSQVRNLGLLTEDVISEKAERWARLDDEVWDDNIDSWTKLKAASGNGSSSVETASLMTGSSEGSSGSGNESVPARRRVLGLGN